jgi:prevent-host-death family protein
MIEIPSTEAKAQWGLISDTAQREPVTITSHGRPSLIVTTVQDYQALARLKYDELKADIQAAADAIELGHVAVLKTDEDKSAFVEGIKARGRARLEQSTHEPT